MSFASIVHTNDDGKHTPFFEIDGKVVNIKCGEKAMHPTTAAHYISRIELYGKLKSNNTLALIGQAIFTPGEIEPIAVFRVAKIEEYSKLVATSYCNLHGIYASEKDL